MGQLTTHVLDISAGLPAAGLQIEVREWLADASALITTVITGKDGRPLAPLVAGTAFRAGRFTLTFHTASYFRARGVILPEPAILEEAVIHFAFVFFVLFFFVLL